MRLFYFASTVLVAVSLIACGGSGAPIVPPPPLGNFSNASLQGQYAFSLAGLENVSGAYFARIGSLTADGSGHITGGLEDELNLSTGAPASLLTFSNGTYQIQANGRGLITLNVGSGTSLQLSVSLKSSSQGLLVESDGQAATSGSLYLQTPAAFSGNSLNGKYVFDFSGISFAGTTPSVMSLIGQFAADGNGHVTGGTLDVNDGAFTPSGAMSLAASTYQLDTNGNGTNFGRGTMTLDGKMFAFYIVDNTRIKLLEEDALGGTQGDAILQTGTIPTQNSGFSGSFVFLTSGFASTGNFAPVTRAGRFTADGMGGIGTVVFDQNNDGNSTHVSTGSSTSNTSYSIDISNPGSGRGTFTFHNGSVNTVTYVFYLSSPTTAVIQDVSASIIGDGNMLAQAAGPFTASSLAGNYSFSWNGVQVVMPSPFAENFVGQAVQTSATNSNFSGALDYVELGLNSTTNNGLLGVTLNTGISGTLTINSDGTQDNGYKIAVGSSSPFTINFAAYIANNQTVFLLCTDSTRTTSGLVTQQTQ